MPARKADFTRKVQDLLAKRAGFRCSRCRRPTIGSSLTDADTAVSMGMAAHITAASPRGPRYEPSLSERERKSAANGIWTCMYCGTLIDKDEASYPVVLLRDWKTQREDEAAREIAMRPVEADPVGVKLRFGTFYAAQEDLTVPVSNAASLGLGSLPVTFFGRETIGIVHNDGAKTATGGNVKAVLPDGRIVPLLQNGQEINPGDTLEFTFCISGYGRNTSEYFVKIGDEILFPLAEPIEVEIRVTRRDGPPLVDTVVFSVPLDPAPPAVATGEQAAADEAPS